MKALCCHGTSPIHVEYLQMHFTARFVCLLDVPESVRTCVQLTVLRYIELHGECLAAGVR